MAKPRPTTKRRTARASHAPAGSARAAPSEGERWTVHEATARAAIDFWNRFLVLRMGVQSDRRLDAAALDRLLGIVRAVSWVESRHGTATINQGTRDPMQCGHPRDAWWRQLIAAGGPGQDRFITGPGGSNFWAGDLPEAMERLSDFPDAAKFSGLTNQALGHDDPGFGPVLSYFWGVPFLIHKINTTAGVATFRCGDVSRDRLVDGAVAYNGGGDPQYRAKITAALTDSGALPRPSKAAARAAMEVAEPRVGDVLRAINAVLAASTHRKRPLRIAEATLRMAASSADRGWLAAPVAAAGECALAATFRPPFDSPAAGSSAGEFASVAESLGRLLDELTGTGAPSSTLVEVPLDVLWRDGFVTVALALPATASHTLLLSIERIRPRQSR